MCGHLITASLVTERHRRYGLAIIAAVLVERRGHISQIRGGRPDQLRNDRSHELTLQLAAASATDLTAVRTAAATMLDALERVDHQTHLVTRTQRVLAPATARQAE